MGGSLLEIRPAGPLAGRLVRVEPLEERHREGLREAAAEDPDIFRYMSWPGDFDGWFDDALAAPDERRLRGLRADRSRPARRDT